MPTPAEVQAYVERSAAARGVPGWLAVAIARAESGLTWDSTGDYWVDALHYPAGARVIARTPSGGVIVPAGTPGAVPTSFGPFQLRAGRRVTGDAREAGLGDSALAAGIDVTNPETWRQQVDFSLNWAAVRGTFAQTWSTAVGDLAGAFGGGHQEPIGQSLPGAAPAPEVPGAPAVPSMPEPGRPSGPGPAPAVPSPGFILPPNPLSGFPSTLGGIADAIGALPAAIATPFVAAVQSAYDTFAWLGQPHIWERMALVALGGIVVIAGLVLTGLSFVPKGTPLPVPVP